MRKLYGVNVKKFVVVDDEGLTSWNAAREKAESFATLGAAKKRAKELANSEPGQVFGIYQRISQAWCDVSPACTTDVV